MSKTNEHMQVIISKYDYNIMIVNFCVLIVAFLIASKRKELSVLSGMFILLFPYAYISYVIIDIFMHYAQ